MTEYAVKSILNAESQSEDIESAAQEKMKRIASETDNRLRKIEDDAKREIEAYRRDVLNKAAQQAMEENAAWMISQTKRLKSQYESAAGRMEQTAEKLFSQLAERSHIH